MSETTATTTATTQLSSGRLRADTVYFWLSMLLVLAVVVQFFLAGVGVFGDHSLKVEDASSFDPHRANGDIIGLISLLMLIAALVARVSKTVVWSTVVLVLLTVVAQNALAAGGDSHKWVGGLHALDGVIILGLVGWLHASARRRTTAAKAAS